MSTGAGEAATVAAVAASGPDVQSPQLVMLGSDTAAGSVGGVHIPDVMPIVPPGTAAMVYESALAAPREIREQEMLEEVTGCSEVGFSRSEG